MVCQIFSRQVRAVFFGESGNFLRQLAAVKGFTVGAGNQLQEFACAGLRKISPTRGARPSGAKQALKPG